MFFYSEQNSSPSHKKKVLQSSMQSASHKVTNQIQSNIQTHKSPEFQKYMKFFQNLPQSNLQGLLTGSIQKLQANKITFKKESYHSDMSIFILSNSYTGKIANILVNFSYFTFQIVVLILGSNSIFHSYLMKLAFGGTGNIYLLQTPKKQKFIIKSIRRSSQSLSDQFSDDFIPKSINESIKQYCLTKLFSVLEIGPKVYNHFGFDLVISKDCVQFCLELCSFVKSFDLETLKRSLHIMHQLKIIHGDIKLENIMWSNEYRKLVFIDFGFSIALQEVPGEMTYSHYFGTFGYCYQQMQKLLIEKSLGYVDLYFNDVFCLLKSQKKSKFSKQVITIDNQQGPNPMAINFLLNLKLMKYIYEKDLLGVSELLQNSDKFLILEDTNEVFNQLQDDKRLYLIFLMVENYQISGPEEAKNKIRPCSNSQILKRYLCQLKTNLISYQLMIKQDISNRAPFIWLMYCLFVSFGQDITPRQKLRKKQFRERIINCKQKDLQIIQYLVQYVRNLYSTEQNLIQIFKIFSTKIKEVDPNQTQQQQKSTKKFKLYAYAFDTALALAQKYGVNVFKVCSSIAVKKNHQALNQSSSCQQNYIKWTKKLNYQPTQVTFQNNSCFDRFIISFKDRTGQVIQTQLKLFLSLCSKYYASSKCRVAVFYAKKNQIQAFMEKSLQVYNQAQQKRAKTSINYCFEEETLFYFALVNQIEVQMASRQPSIVNMDKSFRKIGNFIKALYSPQITKIFSDWFLQKLSRIRIYPIFLDQKLLNYWIKKMNSIHEQLLEKFIQTEKLTPTFLYSIYQKYCLLLQFLPKQEFGKVLELYISDGVWSDWDNNKFTYQQKLCFLESKLTLLEMLRFDPNYQKTITHLKYLASHVSDMNSQATLILLLLILKCNYYLSNFDECEQIIERLISIFSQFHVILGETYLNHITWSPYLQFYFSIEKSNHFEHSFNFLIFNLSLYQKMEQNNFEKQLSIYMFLRGLIAHYTSKNEVVHMLSLFIKHYYLFKKKEKQAEIQIKDDRTLGNFIVVFEVLLSSVVVFDKIQQAKPLINQSLLIIRRLVRHSSFYIRKRFNSKFYRLLLSFIKEGVISKEAEKIRLYQRIQFRNPQYICDKNAIGKLLLKAKRSEQRNLLKDKLEAWKMNKNKTPIRTQINLRETYITIFLALISENNFLSEEQKINSYFVNILGRPEDRRPLTKLRLNEQMSQN